MMKSVSVVIPCYNTHVFLSQAILSAQLQTVKPLEIIVVDDGSNNPETIRFLNQLPDEVILIRQENKGLPGARNTGFSAARGEYVLPLDCDDWLDPEFIELGLQMIAENNDVDFVFSWLSLEAESSGILKKNYNFFEQLFLNQIPYCLLQPKKFWEKMGGYDENMRHGYEDWEWNIRLGSAGYKAGVISQPLFHYRVQSSAMLSSISRKKHVDLWLFIRRKYRKNYSARMLLSTWSKWRKFDSTRPLMIYFFWEILFRILPKRLFEKLVSFLFLFSDSSKFRK